jgi:hypothetical protein
VKNLKFAKTRWVLKAVFQNFETVQTNDGEVLGDPPVLNQFLEIHEQILTKFIIIKNSRNFWPLKSFHYGPNFQNIFFL